MSTHDKDVKKVLEVVETLKSDALEEVLRTLFSSGNVSYLPASRVITNILGTRMACQRALMWLIGGRSSTDKDGIKKIHLNKFLCLHGDDANAYYTPAITGEPWFVATPVSDQPHILTTTITSEELDFPPSHASLDGEFTPRIFDVYVKVHSWDAGGAAAAHVPFRWNCMIEGARLYFYIGG